MRSIDSLRNRDIIINISIFLTKITATQNEVALSYHRVRGLYFLAVVFEATVYHCVRDYIYRRRSYQCVYKTHDKIYNYTGTAIVPTQVDKNARQMS